MRIVVELVALELPRFGPGRCRDIRLTEGASVADAFAALGLEDEPALLAMVNGAAVPRDRWPETPLKDADTLSLFRPFKGG